MPARSAYDWLHLRFCLGQDEPLGMTRREFAALRRHRGATRLLDVGEYNGRLVPTFGGARVVFIPNDWAAA